MLTDNELKVALADLPHGQSDFKNFVASRIISAEYIRLGDTGTICRLTADNGWSTWGECHIHEPEKYEQYEPISKKIALDQAFTKLYPFFGFLQMESEFQRNKT